MAIRRGRERLFGTSRLSIRFANDTCLRPDRDQFNRRIFFDEAKFSQMGGFKISLHVFYLKSCIGAAGDGKVGLCADVSQIQNDRRLASSG